MPELRVSTMEPEMVSKGSRVTHHVVSMKPKRSFHAPRLTALSSKEWSQLVKYLFAMTFDFPRKRVVPARRMLVDSFAVGRNSDRLSIDGNPACQYCAVPFDDLWAFDRHRLTPRFIRRSSISFRHPILNIKFNYK
jgi:hypothetical protein